MKKLLLSTIILVSTLSISYALNVSILLVGGGGTGVYSGGGAGGVIASSSFPMSVGTYNIVVGIGGRSPQPTAWAENLTRNGSSTAIGNAAGTTTAIGGGAAGFNIAGSSGGSGGGGGFGGGYVSMAGGAGTAGQGFAGGASGSGSNYGGGGGGAGGVGAAGVGGSNGGNGGTGTSSSITGVSVCYGGGGGGSAYPINAPGTGTCGGGKGWANTGLETSGATSTGGGSGADTANIGLRGGSGVAIISYPQTGMTATCNGTLTTSGSNNICTYEATGTLTTFSTFVVTSIGGSAPPSTSGFFQFFRFR